MKLSCRETATILAALRLYQIEMDMDDNTIAPELIDIATDGGTLSPLSFSEIDTLCTNLNGV